MNYDRFIGAGGGIELISPSPVRVDRGCRLTRRLIAILASYDRLSDRVAFPSFHQLDSCPFQLPRPSFSPDFHSDAL